MTRVTKILLAIFIAAILATLLLTVTMSRDKTYYRLSNEAVDNNILSSTINSRQVIVEDIVENSDGKTEYVVSYEGKRLSIDNVAQDMLIRKYDTMYLHASKSSVFAWAIVMFGYMVLVSPIALSLTALVVDLVEIRQRNRYIAERNALYYDC